MKKFEHIISPEGKHTDFSINYNMFEKFAGSFKQELSQFTELESINIKVSKTDLFFISEIANKEGISKNTLLEYCIERSIEDFLLTLDTYALRTLINYFEYIYDCQIGNNRECFINSWHTHVYYRDCIQMIDQIDGTAISNGNDLPTSPMGLLIEKKITESIEFLDKIKEVERSKNTQSEKNAVDSSMPILDDIEPHTQAENYMRSSLLKDRLDMLLQIETHKNSIENQDFQIVTFRSKFKIVAMMKMIARIVNIPTNQLFFESISEIIADIACKYDANADLTKKVIYLIENNELKYQGFIKLLANNGYIQYRKGSGFVSTILSKNKPEIFERKNNNDKEIDNLKIVIGESHE